MRIKLFIKYLSAATVIFLSSMWLLSYSFYNSMGIDIGYPSQTRFTTMHFRIRWPGNGAFWVGRIAREYISDANSDMELDLGGTILQPPAQVEIHTIWQWLGFWWINTRDIKNPASDLSSRETWVGVPSWLPPLFGCIAWVRKYRR